MLSRSRLCDDAFLAHALAQHGLAQCVVDLVCTRVVEVLTLEVDVGHAAILTADTSSRTDTQSCVGLHL